MKRADIDMLLRDVLLDDEVIEVLHARIPCEDTGPVEFSFAFQTRKADSDRKWEDVIYWLRKTFPGIETRTESCKKVWNFPEPDRIGAPRSPARVTIIPGNAPKGESQTTIGGQQ